MSFLDRGKSQFRLPSVSTYHWQSNVIECVFPQELALVGTLSYLSYLIAEVSGLSGKATIQAST